MNFNNKLPEWKNSGECISADLSNPLCFLYFFAPRNEIDILNSPYHLIIKGILPYNEKKCKYKSINQCDKNY